MFSGLRQNSIIYVLEKKQGDGEKLSLRIGQVLSVSNPQPKYQPNYQLGAQGMETTVDISVKFQEEQMEFKQLPSTAQIANCGDLVVSESRDAIDAEVQAMYRTSKEIVESEAYHRQMMEDCIKIRSILNPQIAKEREQAEKITKLESKVSGMEDTLSDIKGMLSKALSVKSANK